MAYALHYTPYITPPTLHPLHYTPYITPPTLHPPHAPLQDVHFLV